MSVRPPATGGLTLFSFSIILFKRKCEGKEILKTNEGGGIRMPPPSFVYIYLLSNYALINIPAML